MTRNVTTVIGLLALCLSACSKSSKNSGCTASQICSTEFAAVGVSFVDKEGNPIAVRDFMAVNQRTHLAVIAEKVGDPGSTANYHIIATDSNKAEFSNTGDDVKISAIHPLTNKTVFAVIRISGGCGCHIKRIAGPDQLVFE